MDSPAISFDAPLKQATTVPVAPAGVTFDAPSSSATTVDIPHDANQPNTPITPQSDEITVNAGDNLLTKAGKVAGGTLEGVGEGVFGTAAGASDILDKTTGMQPGAANRYLHTLAGDNNATHGTAQLFGMGGESLAEFLLGDEALKGASLSEKLLQSGRLAKMIEGSPRLAKAIQIGIDALRSGVAQGTVTSVKTGGDAKQGAEQGLLAAGLTGGLSAATEAAPTIRKAFSLKAVQDALQGSKESTQQALQSELQSIQDSWHGSVRDLFDQVANEAGVKPKPAESIRDIAANTAAAVKSQASAMYKQLDQAVGGTRFQTFDEQIGNVKRALRNSAGIDPDADGRLIERINDLEDAKAAALDQAKAAGVDPKLIDKANAAWRQASALEDLSKHIQASTSGLRSDLSQGVKAASEALSPAKLAAKANRLYSTGRLQQALGENHADELLKAIETTKQQAQDAATKAAQQTEAAISNAVQRTAAVRRNQLVGGTIAASAGVPTVWAWLKHLAGE